MSYFVEEYKQYSFYRPSTGGKAGKNKNATSTIQIYKTAFRSMLEKQIAFKMHDPVSLANAIEKAKKWVDDRPIV